MPSVAPRKRQRSDEENESGPSVGGYPNTRRASAIKSEKRAVFLPPDVPQRSAPLFPVPVNSFTHQQTMQQNPASGFGQNPNFTGFAQPAATWTNNPAPLTVGNVRAVDEQQRLSGYGNPSIRPIAGNSLLNRIGDRVDPPRLTSVSENQRRLTANLQEAEWRFGRGDGGSDNGSYAASLELGGSQELDDDTGSQELGEFDYSDDDFSQPRELADDDYSAAGDLDSLADYTEDGGNETNDEEDYDDEDDTASVATMRAVNGPSRQIRRSLHNPESSSVNAGGWTGTPQVSSVTTGGWPGISQSSSVSAGGWSAPTALTLAQRIGPPVVQGAAQDDDISMADASTVRASSVEPGSERNPIRLFDDEEEAEARVVESQLSQGSDAMSIVPFSDDNMSLCSQPPSESPALQEFKKSDLAAYMNILGYYSSASPEKQALILLKATELVRLLQQRE